MPRQLRNMTQGNVTKHIILFSLPVLVGNVFQQLYNIIDSILVGRLVGTDGLAAVGSVGAIQFLFFSLCLGMSSGIGIVVAQLFGAGNKEDVKKGIINGSMLLLLSSLVISCGSLLLAGPALQWMGTPQPILEDASSFLRILCVGLIAVALYNCVAEILRALGDSRTPLIFLIISTLINVVLDAFLILVFHMGVQGAALATVISQFFSAVGVLLFALNKNPYFRFAKKEWHIDVRIAKQCIRFGLPVALQFGLIAISCIVLQIVVNEFGTIVIAAFTVTSKINSILSMLFMTLSTTLAAFCGQNIGAGHIDRVRSGFRIGVLIVVVYTLCMAPIVFFGGAQISRLFVRQPEVIDFCAKALRIVSLSYLPLGMIYVTRGVLNGAGDTLFAFLSGLIEMLGRVCLAKPFTMIRVIGVWGIWVATALTWAATGLLGLLRYRVGKWKTF
ncbi:MAG: MATE family efflux transporter [Lachnospiraceae bacterium]